MSVTFTTAAVAVWGLGAIGAVGLGALGLAALKGKHLIHRGRRHRRRYRREAQGQAANREGANSVKKTIPKKKTRTNRLEEKLERQLKQDEESLLSAIQESDENGCGYRLVCELSAKNVHTLTEDEWEILRFVHEGDENVREGTGISPNSRVLRPYQAASRLGSSGYACPEIFRRCDVSAEQIMEIVQSLL